MNAKEYLEQVRLLNGRITRKIEEKEYLRNLATGVGSFGMNPDKVQTSRSNDMIGDAAASIADNEIVLAHAIVQSAAILKQLIKVIMQIPDVRMQCLLMYRYVCLKKWKQIPECMGYAERNIFSLHDQALQEVEKILQT